MPIYIKQQDKPVNHFVSVDEIKKQKEKLFEMMNENKLSYMIDKVACTSLNTVVVTNSGELLICGSNNYNQLGEPNPKPIEEGYHPIPYFD